MFQFAAISDVGAFHEVNDDRILINGHIAADFPDQNADHILMMGFDGVGGEAFGDEAAQLAAECFAQLALPTLSEALVACVALANERVLTAQKQDAAHRHMSTTVAGLMLSGRNFIAVNLGDTRIYRYRSYLAQLSTDHTYRQQLADTNPAGEIPEVPPEMAHVIFRYLGDPQSATPEVYEGNERVFEGDLYFLCSDGLHDVLTAEQIETVLKRDGTLHEACEALVAEAKEAGSTDNISVILCKVV